MPLDVASCVCLSLGWPLAQLNSHLADPIFSSSPYVRKLGNENGRKKKIAGLESSLWSPNLQD